MRVERLYSEVDHDNRVAAEHPGIVAGRDIVEIARAVLYFGTIVELDMESAGDLVTDVVHVAAIGVSDWLDAFRPFPSRVEG
jgi:hypothetical protein